LTQEAMDYTPTSTRIKRSSSVVADVYQSIEATKKRRNGVTIQVCFISKKTLRGGLHNKIATPESDDDDDELSQMNPTRVLHPASDDTVTTSRTSLQKTPIPNVQSCAEQVPSPGSDEEVPGLTTFSHKVSQLEKDLSSFNENFTASSTKLAAVGPAYEESRKSYHKAQSATSQACAEHKTLEDFLAHSEAFQRTQSSEFIAKVIAESRVKLEQLSGNINLRLKEEQECKERTDIYSHKFSQLKDLVDKAAIEASDVVNKLRNQLTILEETLSKCGYASKDADDI